MNDTAIVRRVGEQIVVFFPLTASSGNLTISTPTVDLLDNSNNVIAAGITASGFDAPGPTARVWYDIDTTTSGLLGTALTAGNYRIKFSAPTASSGDANPRRERPSALLVLVN